MSIVLRLSTTRVQHHNNPSAIAIVTPNVPSRLSYCLFATVDSNELGKNIAGHSCISSMSAAVKPAMAAHYYASEDQVSDEGQEQFCQACKIAFADLAERLATRETNHQSWQQLTKQAC